MGPSKAKMMGRRFPAEVEKTLFNLLKEVKKFNGMQGYGGGNLRLCEAIELYPWNAQFARLALSVIPMVHGIGRWDDAIAGIKPRDALRTYCSDLGMRLFAQAFPVVGLPRTYAPIWPRPVHFIFINRFTYIDDVLDWYRCVAPEGVMCGVGRNEEMQYALGEKYRTVGEMWWTVMHAGTRQMFDEWHAKLRPPLTPAEAADAVDQEAVTQPA